MKKVFEKPEVPGLGHKIFLHDWNKLAFAEVYEVWHFLEEDATELHCRCSLDDICLASLKTSGWTLMPGNVDEQAFQRRRIELKGKITASQII